MNRYLGDRRAAVVWTEAEKTQLKYLMTEGHTATEIGQIIGRTKNSVIGQTQRLGLIWPRTSKEHHKTL